MFLWWTEFSFEYNVERGILILILIFFFNSLAEVFSAQQEFFSITRILKNM